MKLTYVIKFVGDMDRAVAFHRDTLGLPLSFSSPGWSEFATGETKLGLHPASEKNPPGRILAACSRSSWTRKAATSLFRQPSLFHWLAHPPLGIVRFFSPPVCGTLSRTGPAA
jgi:hypothetical protein